MLHLTKFDLMQNIGKHQPREGNELLVVLTRWFVLVAATKESQRVEFNAVVQATDRLFEEFIHGPAESNVLEFIISTVKHSTKYTELDPARTLKLLLKLCAIYTKDNNHYSLSVDILGGSDGTFNMELAKALAEESELENLHRLEELGIKRVSPSTVFGAGYKHKLLQMSHQTVVNMSEDDLPC